MLCKLHRNIPIMLLLRVISVLLVLKASAAAPVVQSDTQALIYLAQFGYLAPSVRNPNSGGLIDSSTWTKAVAEFQGFAGINATGELDEETMSLMSLPRCGVKDKVGFGSDSRSKRYALQGSRWRVKNLTYKVSKYPRLLKRDDVDKEIERAFSVWSTYTDLTFTAKKSGQVHIEIRFEKGEHGDGDPFDGPGGTLAHAYFPVYGGDAHFDDAEQWSINSYRGTNLLQVAAHEFGHSLGLSHSDVKSALMAPFYRGYDPTFELDSDDIQGIQALYGSQSQGRLPSKPADQTTTQSYSTGDGSDEDSELCTDPKIDAMFNTADRNTYVFKGSKYWRLTEDGVARGYPRKISETWVGLPGDIDAAFTYKNGKTYFFKGSQYWRYAGTKMDGDYPKDISDGFTGIPDNVDAALVWSGNGKIYFYKGSKFWRFDPSQRPPVKSTYPKPIANWEGVPDNLEASLQYTNGYTYFFKGGKYYRFNDRTFSVDSADPAFPRPSGHWWFGCKSSSSALGKLENEQNKVSGGEHDVSDIILDADGGTDSGASPEHDKLADSGSSILHQSTAAVLLVAALATLSARFRYA